MNITLPETDNLIFIDTEFSSLDPYTGEVLSIGIVKLSGEELYLELECEAELSDWVKKQIKPMLKDKKVSRQTAIEQINEFLGGTNPFAVAFVDNYDVIYLTKLFGVGNLPFRWMTIDMASILFVMGINPVKFMPEETGATKFYRGLGIDMKQFRNHHALDDAKLLREVWCKLIDQDSEATED